jgi:pimeloyl-ACP methyl ester carboxylesterase
MPLVELRGFPPGPGSAPVSIHFRQYGCGAPLFFLHGGWGYGVYPIDRQVTEFQGEFRIIAPDRCGYGRSTQVPGDMPLDFHRRAADETLAVMDALEIERAAIWGHSDGAVIAAMIGLKAPERCRRLILEAFHYFRSKPGSRTFFQRFSARPDDLGEETQKLLAEDHGKAHWKGVVSRNCNAWLRLGDGCVRGDEDLYDGHLGKLAVPTMFLHGRWDPRTEPDELQKACAELPRAAVRIVENGRHSPHSEAVAYEECNRAMKEFLESVH